MGPPCLCVSPFCRVGSGAGFGVSWAGPMAPWAWFVALRKFCQRVSLTAFRCCAFRLLPASSVSPSPAEALVRPCQSSAKAFFLPDSDASFSAAGMLRFGSVFGLFGAAVPLRFPVVRGWLWGLVFGAQPSPAKALPDRAVCSAFGAARLGPPTQPSPASLARFRLVWGRHAGAFPCCEEVAVGPGFWCRAQPCQSSAKGFVCTGFRSGSLFQPSTQATPAQPAGIAKAMPKAFLPEKVSYRIQTHRSRPQECFVLGPFLACLGPPCRCVSLL